MPPREHYRVVCRICLRTLFKSGTVTMAQRKVPRAVKYDYCSLHRPEPTRWDARHAPIADD